MNEITDYVASVAKFFKLQLGAYLTDVYKLGSLALHPIELALECRYDRCSPEKIFSEEINLENQLQNAMLYLSK